MGLAYSYQPVIRYEYIHRLQIRQVVQTPIDCSAIHRNVQDILSLLDGNVRSAIPNVIVSSNSTSGTAFSLFSYRVFSLPDIDLEEDSDAVVVGITISKNLKSYVVQGDISGEETGRVFYPLVQHQVDASTNTLKNAVEFVAATLAEQGEVVVNALRTFTESE